MDLGYSRLQSGLLLQMSEVCVCLFIGHNVEPDKIAEAIEMPVGMWTLVDPRKHISCGPQIPSGEEAILGLPLRCGLSSEFFGHIL